MLDKIHSALQRFTDGTFGPMFRTQIKKIAAVRAGECYKVLYQTAYTLPGVQEGQSAKLPPSSIRLEMKCSDERREPRGPLLHLIRLCMYALRRAMIFCRSSSASPMY